MTDRLKRRLNITDNSKDELLEDIIEGVKDYIVNYCNRDGTDDIPSTLNSTIIKMAVIDYNRLGTEGLTSESYAGASYNYEGYPNEIMRELIHERIMRRY